MKPFLVAVEGNLGSGKSTMLDYFHREFPDDVSVHPEPVERWRDLEGHNLLQMRYRDPQRWSFQFQSYVILTRLHILKEEVEGKRTTKLVERSVQSNRHCFLPLDLNASELAVLQAWHGWLEANVDDLSPDLFVYLRTDPEVSLNRVRARGRPEEAAMPLDRLSFLHDAHEDWLVGKRWGPVSAPVLVVDANGEEEEEMVKTFRRLAPTIMGQVRLEAGSTVFDDGK